jgi:tRNA(Arg) A34 adenosine deaminase TadA
MTERELHFMQAAVELARQGMESGAGGPFGCVIVKGEEIVGQAYNGVTSLNDPTAHAEVLAIREACRKLQSYQLEGCELYTSCEPCPMCMGAIYWARPDKVFFGATRFDAAFAGFDDSFIYDELSIPMENRRMRMESGGREVAVKVFEEWMKKENKKHY